MAREQIIELVDDIDGSKSAGVETVRLYHPETGKPYDTELHARHRKELAGQVHGMAKFFDHARPAKSDAAPSRGRRGMRADREQRQAIRAWAQANGYDVGERGRIPNNVMEAFNESH